MKPSSLPDTALQVYVDLRVKENYDLQDRKEKIRTRQRILTKEIDRAQFEMRLRSIIPTSKAPKGWKRRFWSIALWRVW